MNSIPKSGIETGQRHISTWCWYRENKNSRTKEGSQYLNVTLLLNSLQVNGPTLILTWIPNSTLKKNPRSIESSPNRSHATTPSPRRTPRQEFAKSQAQTPSPSNSPRGSCVSCMSTASDMTEHYYMDRAPVQKGKKLSIDNSSMNSDECTDSWSNTDDLNRKLSSSNKSQTDSGIGTDEVVQNNEKSIPKGKNVSQKVGANVNVLHSNFGSNCENKALNKEEEISSTDTSDGLTPEEQLAAMLNRNKLHTKARERLESNKSVSIEMNGDNLVVVTEELEHPSQIDTSIQEKNLNKNESKFDTSSSSQSTDAEGVSLSSDSTHPSPSATHYNKMLEDLKDNYGRCEYDSSTCDSSDTVTDSTVRSSSRSKVPTHLQLNTNYSDSSLTTPDISVTRCRYSSSSSSLTSGPDSHPPTPDDSPPPSPTFDQEQPKSPASSDSTQVSHNLTFPHNYVSYSTAKKEKRNAKDQVCGVFSVDLGK